MNRTTLSALVLSLLTVSAHAEVHILKSPPKQEASTSQGWKVGGGVIPVPGSAQRPAIAPQGGAQVAASNFDQDEGQDLGNQQEVVAGSGVDQEADLVGFDAEVAGQDFDYADDGQQVNTTAPVSNLSKKQRRERKIANRSRTDILNLDLHDDSRARDAIKNTRKLSGCDAFSYEEGLLRDNLVRMLEVCGYTLGQWEFGDMNFEFDFPVKKAYTVEAKNLVQFLEQVKQTYLVEYNIHELDKTVDFMPSRGERLHDMELRYR